MLEPQRIVLSSGGHASVADITQDETIRAMSLRLLDGAPPRFSIVGLSLGAVVAVDVASIAPERVLSLVLLDTNLAAATPSQAEMRNAWNSRALGGEFEQLVREELVPIMTARHGTLDELVVDMALTVGVEGFVRQNHAIVSRPDLRPTFSRLQVPVLVACGAADALCRVDLHESLVASHPGAVLRIIPRAGHLSTVDEPQAVNDLLLDWFRSTTR